MLKLLSDVDNPVVQRPFDAGSINKPVLVGHIGVPFAFNEHGEFSKHRCRFSVGTAVLRKRVVQDPQEIIVGVLFSGVGFRFGGPFNDDVQFVSKPRPSRYLNLRILS